MSPAYVRDNMSGHKMGLALALYVVVNLASGQNAGAAPDTNPIGKVLTVTGTVRIDHPAAITVQANLSANSGEQTKVGDLVIAAILFRPDQMVSLVLASRMGVRSASPLMRAWS